MKVLVYGANGWIGAKVCYLLVKDGHTVVKGEVRADQEKEVEQELLAVQPTHVMSFIGRTHGTIGDKVYPTIDYLEQKGKLRENVRDNLYSPVVLALLCKKLDIHFTYMGTGCIFEYDDTHLYGEEDNGFTEDDSPNFFGSSYSIVKGYTDRLMQLLYNESSLNLRIRMPITDEINDRNFITKITNYKKICSIPNSMSVLDELLPLLIEYA